MQRWRARVDWITQAGGLRHWSGEVEAETVEAACDLAARAARLATPALGLGNGQVVDVTVERVR